MIKRKTLVAAMFWCRSEYNIPKEKMPKLRLVKSKSLTTDFMGKYNFDNNTITLYLLNHKSVMDILDTLLHEVYHSTQKIEIYNAMDEYFGYKNNPLEKDAIDNARKTKFRLYKYLLELGFF